MRKLFSLLLLIVFVLLLPLTMGMTLNRQADYDMDGEIDLLMKAENQYAKTGLLIQGEGEVKMSNSIELSEFSLVGEYNIEARSAEQSKEVFGHTEPLTIVVSNMAPMPDDQFLVYAQYMKPNHGMTAFHQGRYSMMFSKVLTFDIDAKTYVEDGLYMHRIELFKPETLSFFEEMLVRGKTKFVDSIMFHPVIKEETEATE
jgi:hypothetical protein